MAVDTMQPAAYAIIGTFLGISTFFMALRVWSRVIMRREANQDAMMLWSDALLLTAYLLVAGETFVVIMYTHLTYQGYHIKDIPKLSIDQKVLGQKYNLANQLLYNPILSLVKASVMLFLTRIGNTKPLVKWALYIAQALNLCLAIAIFFADAFQCSPAHYVYDYPEMDLAAQIEAGADEKGQVDGVTVLGGKCFNQIKFFLISAGLAIMTDIITLLIPTAIVWDLKISRRKKVVASGVLSVGVVVTGTSVARLLVYQWRFSPDNHDRTYGVGYTISSVEANLAVACGAILSLGPLMRRVAPKMFGQSQTSQSRPKPSDYIEESSGQTNTHELKSFGARSQNWKNTKNQTEAWASNENILPFQRPKEGITKDVKVVMSYSSSPSLGGEDERRSSF